MEEKLCDKDHSAQSTLDSVNPGSFIKKDSKNPTNLHNSKAETENSESVIESPTPEKPESRRKASAVTSLARNLHRENFNNEIHSGQTKSVMLPNKYETLVNLFNRMESSIRLLGLKKRIPTFTNICTQVEILTKSKFLSSHLAQMKHLMPEAIQIERILLHDEKSLCMYPDMKITLLIDSVKPQENDKSPSIALCNAFRSRVLSFINSNSKDSEIPEAVLPEPFGSKDNNSLVNLIPERSPAQLPAIISPKEESLNTSHFAPSFCNRIYQKSRLHETVTTQVTTQLSAISQPDKKESSLKQTKDVLATPNRGTVSANVAVSVTPAQHTPKRALLTPDDKSANRNGEVNEDRLTSSARRSLMYSPSNSKGNIGNPVSLESKFDPSLINTERKGFDCELEKKSSLPVTFDTICLISRTSKSLVMTKPELVHKILANNLHIEDTSEVEEHLTVLEELVPDWISKSSLDGGIIYSVGQIQDSKSVRGRIVKTI